MQKAQAAQNGELERHVGQQPKVHHPFAMKDRPFADDLAYGVRAAEPESGDDQLKHAGADAGTICDQGWKSFRSPGFLSCSPKTPTSNRPMTGACEEQEGIDAILDFPRYAAAKKGRPLA